MSIGTGILSSTVGRESVLWIALVACFPALVVLYFAIIMRVLPSIVEYEERHNPWLYALFSVGVAGGFLVSGSTPLPISLSPLLVLILPLGGAMYAVDTYLWIRFTDRRIDRTGSVALTPVLVAPVSEELLFRGALSTLIPIVGSSGFILISAVLFGGNHLHEGRKEVLLKTGNGLVYAALFVGTGNLLVPIVAHIGYNLAYVEYISGRIVGR